MVTSTTLWTSIDTVAHPLFGVTMLLPTLGSYATSSRKIYSHNFADVARGVVFILLLQSVMAGAKPNPIIQLTLHAVWLGLSHKPHIPGFIFLFFYYAAFVYICRFGLQRAYSLSFARAHLTRSTDFITMASQDMISQFTPDTPNIPPTQPDRSRTPTRQPPGTNHHLPTFRGPLHFATTQFRPGFQMNNLPPPPPPTWMINANQRWMNTHMAPMTQHLQHHRLHANQCMTQLLRLLLDRLGHHDHHLHLRHHQGKLPYNMATLDVLLIYLRWNNGNQMSNSTTPTR